MALPTKEEIVRRKKVMRDAGIPTPNIDETWGPWWENRWQNVITHPIEDKYYGEPSVFNFLHKVWDKAVGNKTFKAEPIPRGGAIQATDMSTKAQIGRTLRRWKYEGDPVRDVVLFAMPSPDKPVKLGKAVGTIAKGIGDNIVKFSTGQVTKEAVKEAAKKTGAKTAEFIIREVPRASVGTIAGKTVDGISKAVTGKSWSENASEKMSNMTGFHVEPIFGELTNPGYIGGYKWMDRGIRRASINQITPLGYDDGRISPLTKLQEGVKLISDIPRQLFSIKDIATPAWRSRVETKLAELDWHNKYNPNGYDIIPTISNKNLLDNREDALRLAFGFKPKTNLYVPNGDGTYSYNLDLVYSQNPKALHKEGFNVAPDGTVTTRYTYTPKTFDLSPIGKPYKGYGDNLAYNGGGIEYAEKDGVSYLTDVWDLQPFKDEFRLPSFSGAKLIHKYTPDLEVLNTLGGKPFTFQMSIPTYVDLYPSF